ncbi:MAG: HAD-IA family hydrolase [Phycisphaeraceae bacterium]|nr:HAD-IA family hydrolase [Phycisphaeraceae bacterium]
MLFDLGGVLIRIASSWRHAAIDAGVPVTDAVEEPQTWGRMVDITRQYERGRLTDVAFARAMAALARITPEQVVAVWHAWVHQPYPGILELLHQFAAAKPVPLACLSNTNPMHWAMVTSDGPQALPLHLFDRTFTSFQIGLVKPDPLIFAHVEQAAGVPPSSILYFDDNGPNCQAAMARQWQTHRIDPAGDTASQIRSVFAEHDLLVAV